MLPKQSVVLLFWGLGTCIGGLGVPLWGSHCMVNSLPRHHSFSLSSLPPTKCSCLPGASTVSDNAGKSDMASKWWSYGQAGPLFTSVNGLKSWDKLHVYEYIYIHILFIPINGLKTISKTTTRRRWWSGLKFNLFPKAWNRNLNTGCSFDTFSPKMTCKFFIGARQWKVKIHFVQPFN